MGSEARILINRRNARESVRCPTRLAADRLHHADLPPFHGRMARRGAEGLIVQNKANFQ